MPKLLDISRLEAGVVRNSHNNLWLAVLLSFVAGAT
ncbi:MAG: hypothetical protein RL535_646, partial [Pseudomonadota bacterium]